MCSSDLDHAKQIDLMLRRVRLSLYLAPLTPDHVHAVILFNPLLKKSMRRQVAPHQAGGRQARPSLLDTLSFMSGKQLAFSTA